MEFNEYFFKAREGITSQALFGSITAKERAVDCMFHPFTMHILLFGNMMES